MYRRHSHFFFHNFSSQHSDCQFAVEVENKSTSLLDFPKYFGPLSWSLYCKSTQVDWNLCMLILITLHLNKSKLQDAHPSCLASDLHLANRKSSNRIESFTVDSQNIRRTIKGRLNTLLLISTRSFQNL